MSIDPTIRRTLAAAAVAMSLSGCALPGGSDPGPRPMSVGPAPTSYDGHVAGRPTDAVLLLVPETDPATPGLAMAAGDVLCIELPPAFERDRRVPVSADTDRNLVLTRGWPQAAVRLAGQYRVDYDPAFNALTVTALKPIATDGAAAPGIKAVHLRGRTFVNPGPGTHVVTVTHLNAAGRTLASWEGRLAVAAEAPPARAGQVNFHLPPGTGADHQRVAVGQPIRNPLGVQLFGRDGVPLNGVGIAPPDPARHPRYTGGLLVQDRNGDRRLDPAVDTVVGGIVDTAPPGASGQALTSPLRADGTPLLSGEVLRDAGFPAALGGGKPSPGLLAVQFRAGSMPGAYRPAIELFGGNAVVFTVNAVAR